MACPYANLFGRPGEGAHAYRIANIAVVDTVLTIVVALLVARWAHWNPFLTLLGAFGLGIILHRVFCVRTTVDRLLFQKKF